VIDLAELIEHPLNLGISGQALARLADLGGRFQQERLHLPFGKAAVEIKERAMLGPGGVAVAVGLATLDESLDQRGVEDLWGELKGAQQMSLSLAQGQGGSALKRLYPTHIYR
jgi:hypothetical protein